jgi:hypothetical protein
MKDLIRWVLAEAAWVAALTLGTVFPILGFAHNFQHPHLTQMQVLLSVPEWHWFPFTAFVAAAWAVVLLVRALRTRPAKTDG